MMYVIIFLLRVVRKLYETVQQIKSWLYEKVLQRKVDPYKSRLYEKAVDFFDQEANDYVRDLLLTGKPCMISKFGGLELSALVQYQSVNQGRYCFKDYVEFIKRQRPTLWWPIGINPLCSNAGFFPNNPDLLKEYYRVNKSAVSRIDVLGSYLYEERFFDKELKQARRINIDGYYAPFYYKNPWTIALKNKKVLVVHPFVESIKSQYQKRDFIWDDKTLLPDFELVTIKAVQTMLGEPCEYSNWFEALESMKKQMSEVEYDIALIGCGAYGMPLAAYAKEQGKQSVHLAGWTQVLFGIKGKRWVDSPTVCKFMNEYWVSPLPDEIPQNFRKVEDGCYW